jgi:hypothetical protein
MDGQDEQDEEQTALILISNFRFEILLILSILSIHVNYSFPGEAGRGLALPLQTSRALTFSSGRC